MLLDHTFVGCPPNRGRVEGLVGKSIHRSVCPSIHLSLSLSVTFIEHTYVPMRSMWESNSRLPESPRHANCFYCLPLLSSVCRLDCLCLSLCCCPSIFISVRFVSRLFALLSFASLALLLTCMFTGWSRRTERKDGAFRDRKQWTEGEWECSDWRGGAPVIFSIAMVVFINTMMSCRCNVCLLSLLKSMHLLWMPMKS